MNICNYEYPLKTNKRLSIDWRLIVINVIYCLFFTEISQLTLLLLFCIFSLLQLLYFSLFWMGTSVRAQSSFYRRAYYSPMSSSPTHYFTSHPGSHEFMPLSYSSDLHTEESKRKESPKKYAKKISYRHVASVSWRSFDIFII